MNPLVALAYGVGAVLVAGLVLYWFGPVVVDAAGGGSAAVIAGAILLVPCLAVVLGVALVVIAWADLRSTIDVAGPILRLRAFGDENRRRCYVAVDDGVGDRVRALKVSPALYTALYTGLGQGHHVTIARTRNLGFIRSIVPAAKP